MGSSRGRSRFGEGARGGAQRSRGSVNGWRRGGRGAGSAPVPPVPPVPGANSNPPRGARSWGARSRRGWGPRGCPQSQGRHRAGTGAAEGVNRMRHLRAVFAQPGAPARPTPGARCQPRGARGSGSRAHPRGPSRSGRSSPNWSGSSSTPWARQDRVKAGAESELPEIPVQPFLGWGHGFPEIPACPPPGSAPPGDACGHLGAVRARGL